MPFLLAWIRLLVRFCFRLGYRLKPCRYWALWIARIALFNRVANSWLG